jgi:hypothetical protein
VRHVVSQSYAVHGFLSVVLSGGEWLLIFLVKQIFILMCVRYFMGLHLHVYLGACGRPTSRVSLLSAVRDCHIKFGDRALYEAAPSSV